jgi:hypothetical protein
MATVNSLIEGRDVWTALMIHIREFIGSILDQLLGYLMILHQLQTIYSVEPDGKMVVNDD